MNLGKATLKDVSAYFKLTDDTKRDLVDFIGERFKSSLHGIDLEELPDEKEALATTYDEKLAIKLWTNRLYFDPGESDNIVRRGDIIYKDADGKDMLYLVISADCDLDKFWHKCFGKINLIPLIKKSSIQPALWIGKPLVQAGPVFIILPSLLKTALASDSFAIVTASS